MDKVEARLKLRKTLLEMTSEQRTEKSKKACQNLLATPEFQKAATVMLYLSMPNEVDTDQAILDAWKLGKTVAVPKLSAQQRTMSVVRISSLEDGFSVEPSGLRNPVTGVPVSFEEIELVVTPGLGFDKAGNRLGRGGACYDRFFANKKLKAHKCGLAFTEQVIESVPVADHDQPLDLLVTDMEVIYLNHKKGE